MNTIRNFFIGSIFFILSAALTISLYYAIEALVNFKAIFAYIIVGILSILTTIFITILGSLILGDY